VHEIRPGNKATPTRTRCSRMVSPLSISWIWITEHANSFHCNFTFLEEFKEPGNVIADVERLPPPPRHVLGDTPGRSEPATVSPESTNTHEPVPERLLTQPPQVTMTRTASPTPVISDSGPLLPKHVQVVRRRKPFRHEDQDREIPTDQYPPIVLPNHYQTIPPRTPQIRFNHLDVLHALYMYILFCFPDRYRRDAPSIPPPNTFRPPDSEQLGEDDVFHRDWQIFYKRVTDEWIYAGSAAGVLFR
jgi:hypothetical protein